MADTLPTFLIVGAMKAGTTSLWRYLGTHPQVFLPDEKEPDFFVEEKAWSRGLEWYRSLFTPGADRPARGEASTNYTKHPLFGGVPARIASVLPNVRIVYVVRDPMERIVSHYRHALRAGWERRTLEQAITADPQYVAVAAYASQLRRYHEHFSAEQILVVTAEGLRDQREATVAKVLTFLGVAPSLPPGVLSDEHHAAPDESPRRGVSALVDRMPGWRVVRRFVPASLRSAYTRATRLDHPARVALSDETRARVLDQLRPEVADLQVLANVSIDGWMVYR